MIERDMIPTPEQIGEDVCAVLRAIFTELERNRRGLDALTERVEAVESPVEGHSVKA